MLFLSIGIRCCINVACRKNGSTSTSEYRIEILEEPWLQKAVNRNVISLWLSWFAELQRAIKILSYNCSQWVQSFKTYKNSRVMQKVFQKTNIVLIWAVGADCFGISQFLFCNGISCQLRYATFENLLQTNAFEFAKVIYSRGLFYSFRLKYIDHQVHFYGNTGKDS